MAARRCCGLEVNVSTWGGVRERKCVCVGVVAYLHDAHDWRVALRRDDVPGHHHELLGLGPRVERLRQVQVHLVAV